MRDRLRIGPAYGFVPIEIPRSTVQVEYTNYKGKSDIRTITPLFVHWGSNMWHREPQWLLLAFDEDRGETRDFALSGFGVFPPVELPPEEPA